MSALVLQEWAKVSDSGQISVLLTGSLVVKGERKLCRWIWSFLLWIENLNGRNN